MSNDRTTDDTARANAYALLAACLTNAPDADLLQRLAALKVQVGDEAGQALARLTVAAGGDAESIRDDYHALLIGLGRGLVVPYASYYQTGNMMDLPLARLRADLAALGMARQEGVGEPEDHAGALCELMAMLCRRQEADAFALQKRVFEIHIGGWMEGFFIDIARESTSDFYRAAGDFGAAFMRFEKRYYEMMF